MAVVTMKKLRLIGLSSEKQKIIGGLLRSGAVHLKPTQEIELTVRRTEKQTLDKAASVYSRLTVALEFLASQEKEAKRLIGEGKLPQEAYSAEKKPLLSVREEVSADDFEKIVLEEEALLSVCAELEGLATEKNEIASRRTALQTLRKEVLPYQAFPMKFSEIRSTRHTDFLLGTIKNASGTADKLAALAEKHGASVETIPPSDGKKGELIVFSVVEKGSRAAYEEGLIACGYTPCAFDFECTPAEKLAEIDDELRAAECAAVDCTAKAVKLLPMRKQLRLLSDNATFRMDITQADGAFAKTEKTFILEGFVPELSVEAVDGLIGKATKNVWIEWSDVEEADCPPTLLKNNGLVAPYESITNTYSPPSYYEADPNPAVAVFYFLFFGIMLGDAGYGLILAIAAFLAVKILKPGKGTRDLLLVFGMGGISAIVWGILFGGIFSIEGVKPILFTPMNDPILMLVLCFALGLLHIFVGMGYQAAELIKRHKAMDAVYDIFSWYTIFLGAGLALIPMFVGGMPEFISTIGLVVLAVGVFVLMFGGAVREKGVIGKIIGAVKPLYGIINYFSDIMSYSRLFGLCLASGVIGLVFNTLGGVILSIPFVGWLLAAVVYLIGHTLNFAIGLLGIYVHDSRLQYIEFFGRFYHGGGKLFSPLGLNLKYVTIKQEV